VTEFLYKKFPERNEGDLTAYRSALVNAVTIGKVAEELSFNDLLMLSKGEAKDMSKARQSILADAYEAFLGAVYLSEGYMSAKRVVEMTIIPKTKEVIEKGLYKDAKSFVQEKAQEVYSVTPTYSLVEQTGPDPDKRFVIAISFGQDQIALGEGKSKQEAETNAAKNALIKKSWIKEE
jgi:ribonuclease-3